MTMRRTFHDQLAEAEQACLRESGLVMEQLERVMRALRDRDAALAEQVISGDDAVDELYVDIERKILTLLATQAPVASDLRLVSAMLHVNIHLERMADLCTNVAKFVHYQPDFPATEDIMSELAEMGMRAGRMLDRSMRAFASRDLSLAGELAGMDDRIDRLNRSMLKAVVPLVGDEVSFDRVSKLILVSRYLERFADHAVDIGEQVAFLITGEFREFTDASH